MNELAKNALMELIGNWQKTFITVLIVILSFPATLSVWLLLQNAGWVPNQHDDLMKSLNRVSGEMTYYQQRTCINTSTDAAQRNDCIKPRWERQMDDM